DNFQPSSEKPEAIAFPARLARKASARLPTARWSSDYWRREEVMGSLRQPVEHHWSPDLLRLAPSIEKATPLQVHAHVLHTHVGHSEAISEIPHRQALCALQLVDDLQTLAAANLLDDTLVRGK